MAIWEKFPLNFKYLASARELDGKVALVLVLEDGYNEESQKDRYTISYCPIHKSFYCRDLGPYLREVSKFITVIKSSNFS